MTYRSLTHDKGWISPYTHSVAFWLKPVVCAFSLFPLTMFIEHSHVLTILPTLGLSLKRFREHFSFTAWVPVVLHRRYVVRGASIAHVGYCGWDRRSCSDFSARQLVKKPRVAISTMNKATTKWARRKTQANVKESAPYHRMFLAPVLRRTRGFCDF